MEWLALKGLHLYHKEFFKQFSNYLIPWCQFKKLLNSLLIRNEMNHGDKIIAFILNRVAK